MNKRITRPVIICDKCRKIINQVKPTWKKAGDIEYYYLKCNHCDEIYTVSATDTALRRDIKRYKEMAHNKQPAEKESQELLELLKANLARSREIKEKYSLKLEDWQKGKRR